MIMMIWYAHWKAQFEIVCNLFTAPQTVSYMYAQVATHHPQTHLVEKNLLAAIELFLQTKKTNVLHIQTDSMGKNATIWCSPFKCL